ncbi:hypothetical protein ES5_09717, partial [Dietzia cinnamea P4]
MSSATDRPRPSPWRLAGADSEAGWDGVSEADSGAGSDERRDPDVDSLFGADSRFDSVCDAGFDSVSGAAAGPFGLGARGGCPDAEAAVAEPEVDEPVGAAEPAGRARPASGVR